MSSRAHLSKDISERATAINREVKVASIHGSIALFVREVALCSEKSGRTETESTGTEHNVNPRGDNAAPAGCIHKLLVHTITFYSRSAVSVAFYTVLEHPRDAILARDHLPR